MQTVLLAAHNGPFGCLQDHPVSKPRPSNLFPCLHPVRLTPHRWQRPALKQEWQQKHHLVLHPCQKLLSKEWSLLGSSPGRTPGCSLQQQTSPPYFPSTPPTQKPWKCPTHRYCQHLPTEICNYCSPELESQAQSSKGEEDLLTILLAKVAQNWLFLCRTEG